MAAARPKTVPSHGELSQALRISTQKPLAEAAVLRRYLCEDLSKVDGVRIGGGVDGRRIWWSNSSLEAQAGRGPRRVVNDDDDDSNDADSDGEGFESMVDIDCTDDSDDNDDSDEFFDNDDNE